MYIEENKLVKEEYLSIMKDYYESKRKINILKQNLQVKIIDELIYKFNIQNDKYKSFTNKYSCTNNELISLSNCYSGLEYTQQNLKQNIKVQQDTSVLREHYYDCKINKNKQKVFSFNNKELINNVEQRRCLCEQIFFYMSNLILRILNKVPQLMNNLMLDSYDKIHYQNITIINEMHSDNIKYMIILFKKFSLCLFYLLFNTISKELSYNTSFEHNKQGFVIVPLFTKKNINLLSKEIERMKEQNKNNLLKKNEISILKNLNIISSEIPNEMSSEERILNLRNQKMKQSGKFSQTNMFSRFISYIKVQQHNSISLKKARNEYVSQEEESNAVNFKSKYIEGHERQIKNLFSKFQNDLVYKDKNPNDYTTFYYIKPSNFGKTSLTNFQQSTKMETSINKTTIGKSIFNLEPSKIISKSKVKQTMLDGNKIVMKVKIKINPN